MSSSQTEGLAPRKPTLAARLLVRQASFTLDHPNPTHSDGSSHRQSPSSIPFRDLVKNSKKKQAAPERANAVLPNGPACSPATVPARDPHQGTPPSEPEPVNDVVLRPTALVASNDGLATKEHAHDSSFSTHIPHSDSIEDGQNASSGSPSTLSPYTPHANSTWGPYSDKSIAPNPTSLCATLRRMILSYCIFLAQEIPTHLLLSALLAVLGGLVTEMLCTSDHSGGLSRVWCADRIALHQRYIELSRNVVSLEKALRTNIQQCDSFVTHHGQGNHQSKNFANLDDGALPIVELTSPTFQAPDRPDIQFWRKRINRTQQENHPPSTALKETVTVGSCWPMKGSTGRLGVRLTRDILIRNFTIAHVRTVSPSLSAPKDIILWAVVKLSDHLRPVLYERVLSMSPFPSLSLPKEYLSSSWDAIPLGTFVYNIHHEDSIQSFTVDPILERFHVGVGLVVLEVVSNWGSTDFTCLYNLGVYGSIP